MGQSPSKKALTMRQRALVSGDGGNDDHLLSLPNDTRAGRLLTAVQQEKKIEKAARRREQIAKQDEDQKQETVAKLLQRESGKLKKEKVARIKIAKRAGEAQKKAVC
jgi:anti-sigma28 factor (negative regulator of flagellin synthesis)